MQWYDLVNVSLLLLIWILVLTNARSFFATRKYWLLFFAAYTLTELIGLPISLKGESNLWLYNISKPIQFLLLIAYFSKVFSFTKVRFNIVCISTFAICTVYYFLKQKNQYNSIEDLLYGAVIIVFCTAYFYSVIQAVEFINLSLSEFWFCSALFIFFGINLCINGSMDFLISQHLAVAQKLFYGLVISSVLFYVINIFAIISDKKYNRQN